MASKKSSSKLAASEGNSSGMTASEINLDLSVLNGVGPTTLKKLKESGFGSLEALATSTILELTEIPGIGEKVAERIITEARKHFNMGLKTGRQLKAEYGQRLRITTMAKALDNLLGGGVETGCITEFAGVFRSGKTQLMHQLAVTVQLPPEKGGLGKGAAWIDTEGTFRPTRIEDMAKTLGLDPDECLDNILVGRAYNSDHQLELTEEALNVAAEKNIGILIIDSLMAHFRAEFVGRGTLAFRQQVISKYLHAILRVIEVKNMACVLTNQVQAKPDQLFGDPNTPIGGNVVAHTSTHRVLLRKGKGNHRVAVILDSPNLPEGDATFQILTEGVRDVK